MNPLRLTLTYAMLAWELGTDALNALIGNVLRMTRTSRRFGRRTLSSCSRLSKKSCAEWEWRPWKLLGKWADEDLTVVDQNRTEPIVIPRTTN